MARIMYDSTTAADIPASAEVVAGYVNGAYRWSDEDWAMFPDSEHVRIVVFIPGQPTPDGGDVLDVEAHDAARAVDSAADWVAERVAAGAHPTIYTSLSTVGYFAGLPCTFWLAHYTGQEHMVSVPGATVVATQYASPDWGSGGHYDLSALADGWPGASPPPAPPPIVIHYPEDKVSLVKLEVSGVVNGRTVSTDAQGWGSTIVPGVANDRFQFAFPNGAGHTVLPQFHSAQDEGGQCRINWLGPPLSPPFEAHIWVAD